MSNPTKPTLRGLKWKAVINGRKFSKRGRYSQTFIGDIQDALESNTIYDAIHAMAEHLKTENADMGIPDSFEIILYPRNKKP